MSSRLSLPAVLALVLLVATANGDPNSQIAYTLTDLGAGNWEYNYTVSNLGLAQALEKFSISFDYDLYDNLAITTYLPPAVDWIENISPVDQPSQTVGIYDAMTQSTPQSLGIGHSAGIFAVSFDRLGLDQPGPQLYEIIDPTTLETIDSGWTIPEPLTMTLLSGGLIVILRKRKTKSHT